MTPARLEWVTRFERPENLAKALNALEEEGWQIRDVLPLLGVGEFGMTSAAITKSFLILAFRPKHAMSPKQPAEFRRRLEESAEAEGFELLTAREGR